MGMYNPPHPGEMLKEFMSDSITVTQLAADLCITRTALSKIINSRTAISTAMAEKLAIAFPFTTPQMWLIWQNSYDLWQLEHDQQRFDRKACAHPTRKRGDKQAGSLGK